MKKEIKEKMTIGKATKILRGFLEKDCYYDTPLYYAIPYLLDYITKLEQSCCEYKCICNEHQVNCILETLHDMEKENKRLNNIIEKAVEYIEYNRNKLLLSLPPREALDIDKLLNILNGRSDK